ncbi:mycofactocin system GMC family oxidoreductase MftG [Mycolicibacterium sp. S2-37]|uniref:mycofactocin dehydrogenase MftG n=1 Tax=Mycolicibacterium sp. S2-37 TaxID=2810297 RepID=UPI001A94E6C9|nr:mycofactocin system GMC family oxidoreductase MftG [Mycolicibacterium sp. S2-37]MBO0678938.1 mycofactocin system GMC family oxidoreductase MftG [Mycolicibacterium sp. S2-37]
MHSDVLIVGAGSAGSVLAERLSADPQRRVTIVDAGPAPTDPRVAAQISDGLRLPIGSASAVVRRYSTTLTETPPRHAQIMRGAVVGGSGAINGGYFCRGLPADYDGWGLPGWGWTDVLPHFRAIETDLDFTGPLHGDSGPITVRRVREFDGCTASFVEAARAADHRWIDDLSGGDSATPLPAGVGAVPLNIDSGTRVGPGGAFLQPALSRANLTLLSNTRGLRVRVAAGRAVGVECRGPSGKQLLTADRIVLSAGAIGTAQLLMLSGVGPSDMLRALGIRVWADLPVGAAPVDHPEWVIPVGWKPTHDLPPLEALLTTDAGIEIRPYTAGFEALVHGRRDDPLDRPHIGVALMRPRSRGRLAIVSTNPAVAPLIAHRYDSEPADVEDLTEGAGVARDIVSGTVIFGEPTWSTSQHLAGTAPMGADDDPAAVLDSRCRVRDVEGLWVVDGSIMPDITSRGPHATIAMIGHRAAEFVSS